MPRPAEVIEERAALDAVGMDRDVHGVPVIEAQPIVRGRLAERAHRQRPPEPGGEELLEARHLGQ